MPSVFSIESINLNGSLLTAKDDRLYINGEQVKNTSGIQISENFFIKGYAPISFYSRWAVRGSYLNETLLNDRFMATGYVITCAYPATGDIPLQGRFYKRKLDSVIDISTITDFELLPKQIFSQKAISNKIYPDSVIGLDITVAPNEMRSISVHLLGYFPAAGHFDKMPRTFNFYTKDEPVTGYNIYEEYMQHDAIFTGFSLYCNESGLGPTAYKEEISGYISGFLKKEPIYVPLIDEPIQETCDPCRKGQDISDWSGYYINNKKFNFPTGGQFYGFTGLDGFSNISGHYYSGFNFTNELFFYGYNDIKYGPGELIDNIGWRIAPSPEIVSGFLSGYLTSGGSFRPLNTISGSGTSDFPKDALGYIIGSSGYFLSGQQYFFQNNIIPTKQKILGFLSGYLNKSGIFTPFLKTNPLSSGGSGYFITKQYFFPNGPAFAGFTGMPCFISPSNGGSFVYSGFSFKEGSGFSGYNWPTIEREIVFGFISGDVNQYKDTYFSGYIDQSSSSGYFTSGKYVFKTGDQFSGFSGEANIPYADYEYSGFFINGPSGISGNNIYSENIIGYISGYQNENGIFSGFTGTLSASGYFIFDNQIKFLTGSRFSGFSGQNYFNNIPGYTYSGFFATNLSGFSGIEFLNSGTGIMTGYIGNRNYYSGIGVLTGAIGFRKYYGNYGSGIMTGYIGSGIIVPDIDFTNFKGMFGFNDDMGYKYSGITSDIQNNFFSGIFTDESGGKTGILIGKIGYRNVPTKLKVSGFIKCSSKMDFMFSNSGFNYNGGNISGISGYYINGQKVPFLTGVNNKLLSINGFNGFNNQSGFNNFGYEYSGFLPAYYGSFSGIGEPYIFQEEITGFVSGVLNNNIFTISTGFSGASGYIIDNTKYQFLPLRWKSGENIIGFLSGYINPSTEQFVISSYPNSGSGYYIGQKEYFFMTGSGEFSGFNNLSGFDTYIGFTYSGFDKFNPISNFNKIPKIQKIIGYISGLQDQFNRFTGFQDLNTVSGSSGYFINNVRYAFPTGDQFSGFSGLNFFYTDLGFKYTGFSFPEGSGFTGSTAPQTYTPGIITGFIGYRLFNSGSGLLTGLIGNRYIPFTSGQFSGISGLSGFSEKLGYEFVGNINNFAYTNLNFIGDINPMSGPGVITGYMGYRNVIKYDKTYGTGILTKIIGYRNIPNGQLTGIFYHKDKYGNKYPTFPFSINSGEIYKEYDSNSFGYFISGGCRAGFDIYNLLSGMKGLNIIMEGYYN